MFEDDIKVSTDFVEPETVLPSTKVNYKTWTEKNDILRRNIGFSKRINEDFVEPEIISPSTSATVLESFNDFDFGIYEPDVKNVADEAISEVEKIDVIIIQDDDIAPDINVGSGETTTGSCCHN